MRHEILGFHSEHARYLRDNCGQLLLDSHFYWPVLRRVGGAFFGSVLPGSVGGSFAFRFSFDPSATCAFLDGVGPRAVGFSVGRMIESVLLRNEAENQIGLVSVGALGGIGGLS